MTRYLSDLLQLLTGIPEPIVALAFVGLAVLILGAGLAMDTAVKLIIRSIVGICSRARARKRVARELADLERGTCDGLTAVQIMRIVDESWVLGSDRT